MSYYLLMSNREERGCSRGLVRMWTNIKNFFARIFSHYPGRRRRTNRSTDNVVTLVHTSRTSPAEAPVNWGDPLHQVSSRAPPRKRYHHDRSPDTLLQIKIALQEQVIKDILCEEIQNKVLKPEIEMKSGEKIMEKLDEDDDDRKKLNSREEGFC